MQILANNFHRYSLEEVSATYPLWRQTIQAASSSTKLVAGAADAGYRDCSVRSASRHSRSDPSPRTQTRNRDTEIVLLVRAAWKKHKPNSLAHPDSVAESKHETAAEKINLVVPAAWRGRQFQVRGRRRRRGVPRLLLPRRGAASRIPRVQSHHSPPRKAH